MSHPVTCRSCLKVVGESSIRPRLTTCNSCAMRLQVPVQSYDPLRDGFRHESQFAGKGLDG